ncbi:MAG: hypothetical protein IKP24_03040 [Alphaproteobacteria bacterium]|nr:hypothetical protein [Alphaproteobacteria bacterium]
MKSWLDENINDTLEQFIKTHNDYNENTIYVVNPPLDGVAYVCEYAVQYPFAHGHHTHSTVRIEQYWDADGKSLGYKFLDDENRISYPKTHVLLRVDQQPRFREIRVGNAVTYKAEKNAKKETDYVFPIDSDLGKLITKNKDAINLALVYGTIEIAKPMPIEELSPSVYRVYDNINGKTYFFDDTGKRFEPKPPVEYKKNDKFKSGTIKVNNKKSAKTSQIIASKEMEM